jgi:lysophospholipase L1-like esterase
MKVVENTQKTWGQPILATVIALTVCLSIAQPAPAAETWIGTWATGQQLVETSNNPASPYLANNTLRQIVHATLGGSRIRVQFSNKYSAGATTINSAHIAVSNGGYPINSSIDTSTDTALTFNNGSASVTIPAGEEIYSDAVDFNVAPLSNLTVSIYFGSDVSSTSVTGHPGSRTAYYLKTGNTVSDTEMESGYKTEHWYVLSRVDVWLDNSYGCVVALGDSITDGRGCNPNYDNRWPDLLAARLNANPTTSKVGVINEGIGGNCVVSGGLGPTATARFDHDVTGQPGVKWVIVFEGTNDIGSAGQSAANIISAYQTFITKAHNAGLKIYGATITPFRGNGYYSTAHETVRQTVNDWIRTSGEFDAVIDFDAAVWDPAAHDYLNPAYRVYPPGDQNDFLHFNAAGFQAMVDSIDLALFEEQRGIDAVSGNMMLINDNGGWCWYQDEKIAYDPVGRNVLTSTSAQGLGFGGVGGGRTNDMDATTFNIDTGKRTRALMRDGGGDDHNMGAFWIRPDGRYLHLYCPHYTDHRTFYRLATNPNDGSAWDSEQSYNWLTIPGSPGSDDISNSSYTNIVYLPSEGTGMGRLYNIHRVFTRTPCIAYSDDWGQNWVYMGRLNSPVGGATYSNFYHKFVGNGVDRIDFIGTEQHPRDYDNGIYHGYIKGGKSYNSYGVEIDTINDQTAPSVQAFTPVFLPDLNQGPTSYHTGWTNEIQLDKDGYPVCLYQTRYGNQPWGNGSGQNIIGAADHRFFYARFNGSTWTSTELCKMGTGMHPPEQDYLPMGCIHPDDANLIYIGTNFDPVTDVNIGHRELFKGVTYDKGLTWNWTQITFNSTVDNIRPAIPKWDANNTAVFWTRGGYPGQEQYDFVVVGMVEEQGVTLGLVSYIDASPSNTTNENGSAFSPTGPSGSAGAADNLWHEYTGYGNNGSCYTAGDGGTENVPTIKTTVSGLSDGTYDVFAYFWCDPNLDWGIRGGFSSATDDMLCFNKQSSQCAETQQFAGSVTVTAPGYRLYRVYIGRKVVSGGGSIVVYLDNYDSSFSTNIPTRTTYDGVGVAALLSTEEDVSPPEPNVMTWATVPTATGPTTITMTATTASDASPPVLYYFECTTDGNKSSSWQTNTTYEASGLTPSTLYSFKVKARDSSPAHNETDWSSTQSATTDQPDTVPPTPNPMTWATVPTATGPYSITMTATTATDTCSPPVQYYFECTNDGSKTSGWQSSVTYSPSGLNPLTLYSFRVKARDSYLTPNETGWSSTLSATTEAPPSNVEIIGSWLTGTSHTKESGGNRALIFIAHEESPSGDPNLTSVTYGGQEMTKIIERSAIGSPYGNYVAAFILNEAGISAATSSDFTPTWSVAPGAVGYCSVFLQNVNQTILIGASDSAGTTSGTDPISTNPLTTNDEDMVILAATCNNLGTYTLGNGFTEGPGADQQFGDATTGGTGVAGYKSATGANETPSADYSSTVNRQVIIGFVVQAGGAADLPPAAPTGLTATPGNERVSLDWNDNGEGDLDGYNVYRSTTHGSGYGKLNVSLVDDSSYTDNTVTNGIPYYYVVTAVDFNSHESNHSNEATATPWYDTCAEVQAGGAGLTSDLTGDCYVNYSDLEIIVNHWLNTDCTEPDNCGGADFEPTDGMVDLHDYRDFAEQWLMCNNPGDPDCGM